MKYFTFNSTNISPSKIRRFTVLPPPKVGGEVSSRILITKWAAFPKFETEGGQGGGQPIHLWASLSNTCILCGAV